MLGVPGVAALNWISSKKARLHLNEALQVLNVFLPTPSLPLGEKLRRPKGILHSNLDISPPPRSFHLSTLPLTTISSAPLSPDNAPIASPDRLLHKTIFPWKVTAMNCVTEVVLNDLPSANRMILKCSACISLKSLPSLFQSAKMISSALMRIETT